MGLNDSTADCPRFHLLLELLRSETFVNRRILDGLRNVDLLNTCCINLDLGITDIAGSRIMMMSNTGYRLQ